MWMQVRILPMRELWLLIIIHHYIDNNTFLI